MPHEGATVRITVGPRFPGYRRGMQSDAVDVDRYVEEISGPRKPVIRALREACRAELTAFTEAMAYGMPGYSRDGQIEISFANQKQYISLYVTRTDVMAAHRDRLAHLDVGKSCIRYRKPEDVDLDVVRSILRATATSTGPVC